MLDSLVVFATQKANDFSSGAVTTIDREIIRFFNQLWGSNGWGNFLLSLISIVLWRISGRMPQAFCISRSRNNIFASCLWNPSNTACQWKSK